MPRDGGRTGAKRLLKEGQHSKSRKGSTGRRKMGAGIYSQPELKRGEVSSQNINSTPGSKIEKRNWPVTQNKRKKKKKKKKTKLEMQK